MILSFISAIYAVAINNVYHNIISKWDPKKILFVPMVWQNSCKICALFIVTRVKWSQVLKLIYHINTVK